MSKSIISIAINWVIICWGNIVGNNIIWVLSCCAKNITIIVTIIVIAIAAVIIIWIAIIVSNESIVAIINWTRIDETSKRMSGIVVLRRIHGTSKRVVNVWIYIPVIIIVDIVGAVIIVKIVIIWIIIIYLNRLGYSNICRRIIYAMNKRIQVSWTILISHRMIRYRLLSISILLHSSFSSNTHLHLNLLSNHLIDDILFSTSFKFLFICNNIIYHPIDCRIYLLFFIQMVLNTSHKSYFFSNTEKK